MDSGSGFWQGGLCRGESPRSRGSSDAVDRIDVALVYGSYANQTGMRPGSDIDLMVIGNVSFALQRFVLDERGKIASIRSEGGERKSDAPDEPMRR